MLLGKLIFLDTLHILLLSSICTAMIQYILLELGFKIKGRLNIKLDNFDSEKIEFVYIPPVIAKKNSLI